MNMTKGGGPMLSKRTETTKKQNAKKCKNDN